MEYTKNRVGTSETPVHKVLFSSFFKRIMGNQQEPDYLFLPPSQKSPKINSPNLKLMVKWAKLKLTKLQGMGNFLVKLFS